MAKTCVVVRDNQGKIKQVLLPNQNQNQNENSNTNSVLRTTAEGKAIEGGILSTAVSELGFSAQTTKSEIWHQALETNAKQNGNWIDAHVIVSSILEKSKLIDTTTKTTYNINSNEHSRK